MIIDSQDLSVINEVVLYHSYYHNGATTVISQDETNYLLYSRQLSLRHVKTLKQKLFWLSHESNQGQIILNQLLLIA